MRFVWCQDFNFFQVGGGAQATDLGYFREGLKRGYDLRLVTPETAGEFFVHPSEDIVVLSNIRRFDKKKILEIPSKNKVVVFHHDYWCTWRLYYPRTGKCLTDCPEYAFWKEVVSGAELNIFLSPLHYDMHRERFGEDIEPHAIFPSAIDPTEFYDQKKGSRKGYGNIQGLSDFKGRKNLLSYAKDHPEEEFHIGGQAEEEKFKEDLPPNVKYEGLIPGPILNSWYNRFQYYIELPDTPQPFNRTVAEAYLAGCKIVGNGLLGALSWPWFTDRESVAENLRKAPGEFWDRITEVLSA